MLRLQHLRKLCTSSNKYSINSLQHIDVQDDFEREFADKRIPLNAFQRVSLGVGSALMSLLNPWRADMIATMGEVTGEEAIKYMQHQMENSSEGRDILRERPRINSRTVDLEQLKTLPEGTLGKIYSDFLTQNEVTPDSRSFVQFVDDVNLAYVMQRYREAHDLVHAVLGMKTNMLGEVTVKVFEGIQTRLPMCVAGGLFGPLRFKPKQRELYRQYYLPWVIETGFMSNFLLNVYFEKRWEQPMSDLHQELGISPLVLPKK